MSRSVVVIGKAIEKRLFPHESPIGKIIKLNGHTFSVIGGLAEKGTAFGQSQDDICVVPITRFFERLRRSETHGEHRHAVFFAGNL